MRKPLFLLLSIAVFIFMVSFAGVSLAQEENSMDYAWGRVASISEDEIVLIEQRGPGEEAEVSYSIDPNVELSSVMKIEDIAVGSSVGIEYEVIDDNKIAKVIDVEEEEILHGQEASTAKKCE